MSHCAGCDLGWELVDGQHRADVYSEAGGRSYPCTAMERRITSGEKWARGVEAGRRALLGTTEAGREILLGRRLDYFQNARTRAFLEEAVR